MNADEAQSALSDSAGLLAYSISTLILGTIVFIAWLTRHGGRLRTHHLAPGWRMNWMDFGWYVLTLALAIVVTQQVAVVLFAGNVIAASLLLAAGALGATLLFLYARSPVGEARFSARDRTLGRSVAWGLGGFLATAPLVFVVTLLTLLFYWLLQNLGLDLVPQPQDILEMISEAEGRTELIYFAILAVFVAPLWEEIVFRGGLYRFLKTRIPMPVAMAVSAALFSLVHSYALGFFALLVVGIMLCVVYEQSGDIRAPMILHALFNANSLIVLFLQGGDLPEFPV